MVIANVLPHHCNLRACFDFSEGNFEKVLTFPILVTGSARLDVYKKGGDSLMGRYFMYRFHPLSMAEILHQDLPKEEIRALPQQIKEVDFQTLWQYGGYPDPYLKRENLSIT